MERLLAHDNSASSLDASAFALRTKAAETAVMDTRSAAAKYA